MIDFPIELVTLPEPTTDEFGQTMYGWPDRSVVFQPKVPAFPDGCGWCAMALYGDKLVPWGNPFDTAMEAAQCLASMASGPAASGPPDLDYETKTQTPKIKPEFRHLFPDIKW